MNTHPEKWYIVATKDNYDELKAWRQTRATSYLGSFRIGNPLLSKHLMDNSYYYGGSVYDLKCDSDYDCYQEITIEQFRQITNSNKIKHPEKWYIGVTAENRDELDRWRQRVATSHRDNELRAHHHTILSRHIDDESCYYASPVEYVREHTEYQDYEEITLEQFRQITNSPQNPKPMIKSIQISRDLLNEYYEAATGPQKAYLTEHFKLDGTTTDEAIRGLYEMACGGWKPKIKANHPDCFPEESKYFDFSEHTNQYGCDSIVSSHIAHSLGLCRGFIQVRGASASENDRRAFYLHSDYNWELVKDNGTMVLIPTKKVK